MHLKILVKPKLKRIGSKLKSKIFKSRPMLFISRKIEFSMRFSKKMYSCQLKKANKKTALKKGSFH